MNVFSFASKWANSLKVGTRLVLGFGVLMLMLVLVGVTGVGGMRRLDGRVTEIVTVNNAKLGFAQSLSRAVGEQEKGLLRLMTASSTQERDEILAAIQYQAGQYGDAKTGLDEILGLSKPTEAETAIVGKILENEAAGTPLMAKIAKLVGDDETEAALKMLRTDAKPALGKWVNNIDELVSIEQRINDSAATATQQDYVRLRNFSLAGIGFALVFGTVIATMITRSLRRDLGGEPGQAAFVAKQIADGNLAVHIPVRPGDTVSLMAALQGTVEQLSGILRGVHEAVETINVGVSEIAMGNSDLSKRTENQAASLEETAATMEELTETVQRNSDNAQQANRLASGASGVAVKGGEVVGQVVATMSSINDSSKKIADIIGVIDGIAFQTNILALNAAVEAARAGEQGRGFAVVASEVRSLASRSAEAAKQIKELINESVGKVEGGTRLVTEAGQTMGEVVAAVQRVTDIMAEITVASAEQSNGISQVNTAIAQMDQVTQNNAALVEQAAAAADSVQHQTKNLVDTVSVFRLSPA